MARKPGKQYQNALKQVEAKEYLLEEAIPLVQKIKFAKFDETVEVHMRLGVDPKHADQMVRGTVVMPNGLGKSKKVLVIASGDKQREATEAGADFVGGEDMVNKIQSESWTDYDAVVATPDMMRSVGKLGKILGPRGLMPNPKTGTVTVEVAKAVKEVKAGKVEFRVDKTGIIHAPVGKLGKVLGPRGLMPNPKTGTVTFDVGKAVKEIKAGKVEYRVDKTAIVHAPIGKVSFGPEKLLDNARAILDSVIKAKPAAAKGRYVKSIALSSTMGPGVRVDLASVEGHA